jgi:hypothetical protein
MGGGCGEIAQRHTTTRKGMAMTEEERQARITAIKWELRALGELLAEIKEDLEPEEAED